MMRFCPITRALCGYSVIGKSGKPERCSFWGFNVFFEEIGICPKEEEK